jgi:predicted nicotinamide N-methyase
MELSTLEVEYLGPILGNVEIYQLPMFDFNQACLSASSKASDNFDSTGKRMYAGAHVAIRFLTIFKDLIKNKTVIELGCGTGAVGLLANSQARMSRLLLTDGNSDTLHITSKNVSLLCDSPESSSHIKTQQLLWGDNLHINAAIMANTTKQFDVVLGCELMYYQTDIALLVSTVLALVSREGNHKSGLFIHSHLFRRAGQEDELIEILTRHNWTTLEVPHECFLSKEELSYHPEWYRVRTLVSGSMECIQQLLLDRPSWRVFSPELPDE